MISKETFRQIQIHKSYGVTQRETARRVGVSSETVRRWWNKTAEEFEEMATASPYYLDQYREFILSVLRLCPQIRATNMMYKLKEAFPDFECSRAAFYRYMKMLREQYGFAPPSRQTGIRDALPPGYEAQVDFGQYKMKDMYDRTVRIYFFCMVLSYSKMGFVYFSGEPFTTKTAIEAHKFAFRYFGGRTQTVMYDQDRVFVVSENLGNILFVPEFEDFVKKAGYSVVLCRPRDPQTKGRVEAFVHHVKESFLDGRIFTGADSLNSAALAWLDKYANAKPHYLTKRPPRELFIEEVKYLKAVPQEGYRPIEIRSITDRHTVRFDGCHYELPREIAPDVKIRIEEQDELLLFYNAETDTLVHKCRRANEAGEFVKHNLAEPHELVAENNLFAKYGDFEAARIFIETLSREESRYKTPQLQKIQLVSQVYIDAQMISAFEHCTEVGICTAFEFIAFLIYRYGEQKGGHGMNQHTLKQCKARANELMEAEYGEHR